MVAGMAMAAAKLNPMVRLISTPATYLVTHIILNIIFGSLNANGVLKNEGPNAGNITHAIISCIVMALLLFFPPIYGGLGELKGQPLFWLLIAHIVVNIAYILLLLFITEEEAKKVIATIYSVASFLVLIVIGIFGNPELREKMKEASKKLKDKISAAEKPATPTENPVAETKAEATEKPATETKTDTAAKDFGKRQRRRNPPKRRRRKKKKY